jgi:hypothetical protein
MPADPALLLLQKGLADLAGNALGQSLRRANILVLKSDRLNQRVMY